MIEHVQCYSFVRMRLQLAAFAGFGLAMPCHAQETITYTYDARGRVVTTTRTGGPVQGAVTSYTYDKADNRTNVTVANSPKGSQPDTGGGATAGTRRLVVVPLNGLSVIMLGN